VFEQLDLDKNGQLTLEEFLRYSMHKAEEEQVSLYHTLPYHSHWHLPQQPPF
jgi:hypothetical protein